MMYYGLTNFYQNHRRYVKSRDDNQLRGILGQQASTDCTPFMEATENGEKKTIVPCGAIANSLFSGKHNQLFKFFIKQNIVSYRKFFKSSCLFMNCKIIFNVIFNMYNFFF